MGRGDKRSRKGKIFAGSFGKSRPHKVKSKATPKKEKVEAKPKKGPAKKTKTVEPTAE
ncbi:MAG TPA: 30S ribosomal protein THX [Chitinophagales bacterium]|jgi:30S ribosomal protein S31|nr:30S ribosomal protein THX [Chitinophagales bacterium]MBP6154898.1 30S ribosomal protein THX [Chitinophagales bacterium]HQV77588.1 30S ribosomal protein THX [Chitinophagales bacterium]HQW79587.1 30S ribosomal protein THX [Chitinophagales bacterium]HRB19982.1 30S ribosomal protein THX [Chitinophagales bacterium]